MEDQKTKKVTYTQLKNNYIVLISFLVLLISILYIIFVYSQKTNTYKPHSETKKPAKPLQIALPTSVPTNDYDYQNWEPYSNSTFGLHFSYPPATEVNQSEADTLEVVLKFPEAIDTIKSIAITTTPIESSPKLDWSLETRTTYFGLDYLIMPDPAENHVVVATENLGILYEFTFSGISTYSSSFANVFMSGVKVRKELPLQPIVFDNSQANLVSNTKPYPEELTNLANTQTISCSNRFEGYDGTLTTQSIMESESFNHRVTQIETLTNQQIISQIDMLNQKLSDRGINSVRYCQTESDILLIASSFNGGGGGDNKTLIGYLKPDGSYNPVEIANSNKYGGPYFSCSNPIVLTRENVLYMQCGAGDGGFGASSILKINLTIGNYEVLSYCKTLVKDTTCYGDGDPEYCDEYVDCESGYTCQIQPEKYGNGICVAN